MSLDWKDGQPYSNRFGDIYFSSDSGIEETHHVFLQGNRLSERFAELGVNESICIGETGFGTGLNFLCTWRLFEQSAPPSASLDFFSVEKFPLSNDELRSTLALWPELPAQALLGRWNRRVPGWNRWDFAGGQIRLTLVIDDVTVALPQLPTSSVDAWFLDGFSPAKNPEMWSAPVLESIARASHVGATLATYTSAGWVRRGLQEAGFVVEKSNGFGRKREMLRGILSPLTSLGKNKKAENIPRTALVIGGGIAGCATAHALAQRGMTVTLVESAPQLASAASGNPLGILHARFGASGNSLHRFVLASYGHVLALLDEVLPVDNKVRAECGVLQLACSADEQKRISRMAEQSWPENLLQFVDLLHASQLAGMEMAHGGLWFPAGGWVVPPQFCASLVNNESITLRLGYRVERMESNAAGWHLYGDNLQGDAWMEEADVVIVCCAQSAKKLAQFNDFPLTSVRGQITELNATVASLSLRSVVCGDGYCAPAVNGIHVIGATHTFEDEAIVVRATDHAENLANLTAYAPALRQALGEVVVDKLGGRVSVRCSAPGAMPLVGKVMEGLYCSLAHGTRGLLTAGLSGEVLVTQICGQLPPLPADILAALAPLPRLGAKTRKSPGHSSN